MTSQFYNDFFGPFLRATTTSISSAEDRDITAMLSEMKIKESYCPKESAIQVGEKGALITILVPGFNPEDVKVESKTKVASDGKTFVQIKVTAETDNKYTKQLMKKEYIKTFSLIDKIEELSYVVENGVCYVFIKTKRAEAEKHVEVKKVGKGFDW